MRIEPFADGACHVGDHLGQAIGIAILASGGRFEERTDATSLKLLMSSRSCQSTAMQAARQSTYGARLVEGNHIKTPWHNDPDPHAPKRRDVVYLRRALAFAEQKPFLCRSMLAIGWLPIISQLPSLLQWEKCLPAQAAQGKTQLNRLGSL